MVLLRLACLTWYLQYCVQHQPWRSTWYLQGTQLLRESNLPTAYCHNQCPKAQVSTLPRIFMMMKYWTSVSVYCNYCCGTFHRLKLNKSVDNPRFELWNSNKGETFWAQNWPSCLPLSSSTALQIKTQSYVLDFQNPFLYLPGPLMRAFHVRPPNIFILFLIRGTSRRKSKVPRHWYCWGVDEDKTLANIGKIQILAGMHHIIGWHEVGGEQRQPCVSFKVVQS